MIADAILRDYPLEAEDESAYHRSSSTIVTRITLDSASSSEIPDQLWAFFRECGTSVYCPHPVLSGFRGWNVVISDNSATLTSVRDSLPVLTIPSDHDGTSRQIILYGIARCLRLLHSWGVAHRDLHPGNIRLEEDCFPHLINVGMPSYAVGNCHSRYFDGTCTACEACLAPEAKKGGYFDCRSDAYSYGVVLWCLVENKDPDEFRRDNLVMANRTFQSVVLNLTATMGKRMTMNSVVRFLENPDNWLPKVEPAPFWQYKQFLDYAEAGTRPHLSALKRLYHCSDIDVDRSLPQIIASFVARLDGTNDKQLLNSLRTHNRLVLPPSPTSSIFTLLADVRNDDPSHQLTKVAEDGASEIVDFLRELFVTVYCRHPAVVRIVAWNVLARGNCLKLWKVSEELSEVLRFTPKLNGSEKTIILYGIARGMSHLHRLRISHPNLNTHHIFLDSARYPRIGFLGTAEYDPPADLEAYYKIYWQVASGRKSVPAEDPKAESFDEICGFLEREENWFDGCDPHLFYQYMGYLHAHEAGCQRLVSQSWIERLEDVSADNDARDLIKTFAFALSYVVTGKPQSPLATQVESALGTRRRLESSFLSDVPPIDV